MLGTAGDMGDKLGIPNNWGFNIIKEVGNYGETYSRNLGPNTPLNLPRGINNLWNNGGIQYAAPLR
jgi:general L-amino acid transport system substrate-binding protein